MHPFPSLLSGRLAAAALTVVLGAAAAPALAVGKFVYVDGVVNVRDPAGVVRPAARG